MSWAFFRAAQSSGAGTWVQVEVISAAQSCLLIKDRWRGLGFVAFDSFGWIMSCFILVAHVCLRGGFTFQRQA